MKTKLLLILLLACIAAPCLAEQGRPIVKGATDQTTYIKIVDAADGTPETGVVAATAGLDLEYLRLGAAAVDLTESDLASAIAAHSDGGIFHVGHGVYRVDLPDAAAASSAGVNEVHVQGTVTGMQVIGVRHPLVAYDPYDAVRLGMTALPNVPTGNAGAVLTAGTGTAQLNVASGNASANLKQIHGSNIPETTPGNIAFNFGWFWDNDNDTPGGIFLIDIAAIKERTDRIPNIAAGSAGGLFIAGSNASTTVNLTGNITGNLSGSVGSLTALGANAVNASALAADAVAELSDGVWDEVLSTGHEVANSAAKFLTEINQGVPAPIAPMYISKKRTWYVGPDGYRAANIVTVKAGFSGTLSAKMELNDAADINTVDSVEVTDPDDEEVEATALAKTADGLQANFDVPTLTEAGTYLCVITVTTLDDQTIPMECTLVVRP